MHSSWLMCCYFADKRRVKTTPPFKWWWNSSAPTSPKTPKSGCSSGCDSEATTVAWGRENSLYSHFI